MKAKTAKHQPFSPWRMACSICGNRFWVQIKDILGRPDGSFRCSSCKDVVRESRPFGRQPLDVAGLNQLIERISDE